MLIKNDSFFRKLVDIRCSLVWFLLYCLYLHFMHLPIVEFPLKPTSPEPRSSAIRMTIFGRDDWRPATVTVATRNHWKLTLIFSHLWKNGAMNNKKNLLRQLFANNIFVIFWKCRVNLLLKVATSWKPLQKVTPNHSQTKCIRTISSTT